MTREEAKEEWFKIIENGIINFNKKNLIDKIYDNFENRNCTNCSTHPSNCRIFCGASKQLALSVKTFNCSLWETKE